jgi:tRNA pseudouridine38-40 synthase
MTEDTGVPIVKRPCDEDATQGSPKRVKVVAQSAVDVNTLNPSSDLLQGDKKSPKRRDAAGYPKSRHRKEKDNKNVGRRRRGSRPEVNETRTGASEADPQDSSEKSPRLPKRQSAILLGFCGTGLAGMQMLVSSHSTVSVHPTTNAFYSQPDARTIEGVLFDALVRVGAVSSDNADDPTKVSLGRAARTDAGVHAAGNLVSLKLITQIPGVPDVVEAVNELLPPEIRVWHILRVQNSFNARTCARFLPSKPQAYLSRIYRSCDSRKYTYFFPSYLLIPPKPGSGLYETLHRQVVSLSDTSLKGTACPPPDAVHPFWTDSAPVSSKDDDLQRKRHWRAGTEDIRRLREIAKKFEGTHNFHNFTVGREFSDRSTQRHMKKIEVSLVSCHRGCRG